MTLATISKDAIGSVYEEARRRLAASQPITFMEDVLGANFFPLQEEMVFSVADNRATSVVGANSSGKDYAAGRIILWWLYTHTEALVVLNAPTHRQVSEIVWRESRRAFQTRKLELPGRMYEKAPKYEISPWRYAIGFSTDRPTNLTGFHSPHLLLIISEAHGVPQPDIEALKLLNPERTLMTGNALSSSGEFFDAHNGASADRYNTIKISAFDTPNFQGRGITHPGLVTPQDAEEKRQDWGEDSPLYRSSVKAEWSGDSDDQIVSMTDAQAALDRDLTSEAAAVLGVDVARFGSDEAVIYKRRGPVARKVWSARSCTTTQVVVAVQDQIKKDSTIERVTVDGVGVGAGVVDRCRETISVPVVDFQGGARAMNPRRYFNITAEVWWEMRKAFQEGNLDITDKALVAQVTSRKFKIRSDRLIQLESKEEIKQRGGRSPDEADALAMTYRPTRGWHPL